MRYDSKMIKPIILGVGLPIAGALFISLFVRARNNPVASSVSAVNANAENATTAGSNGGSYLDISALQCDVALEARKRATQIISLDEEQQCQAVNPFFYQKNSSAPPIDPASLILTSDPDAPMLHLTGVMQGRTSIAVINGNTFSVGDTILDGWILIKIDSDRRSVLISGPAGKKITISAAKKNQYGGG